MPIDRAGRTNDPLSPATTLSHVPFVLVASGSRIVHRELNGRPMRPGSEKVLALSSIKGPVRCENRSFRSSDSRRKALYVNRGVFHRTYRPSPHPTRPRNDLQCGFVSGPDFSQAASCPSSPHPRSLDGSERTSPVCLSSLELRFTGLTCPPLTRPGPGTICNVALYQGLTSVRPQVAHPARTRGASMAPSALHPSASAH
jgi:hypothetical protein